MISWDKKIERAKKLSTTNSAAREILNAYIRVAEFQKNISRSFNGEHSDVRSLLQFLPDLKKLAKELHAPPLQTAIAELGDDQERWSELLLEHWEQHAQMGQPSRAFLAHVLLQPYAQHVTQKMNISAGDMSSRQCPACGNSPQLSVLREFNNGAKRSLVCKHSHCSHY